MITSRLVSLPLEIESIPNFVVIRFENSMQIIKRNVNVSEGSGLINRQLL
jgi:hypothetical protein